MNRKVVLIICICLVVLLLVVVAFLNGTSPNKNSPKRASFGSPQVKKLPSPPEGFMESYRRDKRSQQQKLELQAAETTLQRPRPAQERNNELRYLMSKEELILLVKELGLPRELMDTESDRLRLLQRLKKIGPERGQVHKVRFQQELVDVLVGIGVSGLIMQQEGHSCVTSPGEPDCAVLLRSAMMKLLESYRQSFAMASGYVLRRGVMSPKDANEVWTTVQPTLQCSYMTRACQAPDGCRYLCNMQAYSILPRFHPPIKAGLDFVSVGSNNDWIYEESFLIDMEASAVKVNSMRVYDCTFPAAKITPRANVEAFPGFLYYEKCVPPIPHGYDKETKQITMPDIISKREEFRSKEGTTIKVNGVDILKMDVEGSEFGIIHSALEALLNPIPSQSSSIPQERAENPTPFFNEVGIIQMEIHLGVGSASDQAYLAHWAVLTMNALGFTLARMERNPWYAHCSEMLFVSNAFFLESELAVNSAPFRSIPKKVPYQSGLKF